MWVCSFYENSLSLHLRFVHLCVYYALKKMYISIYKCLGKALPKDLVKCSYRNMLAPTQKASLLVQMVKNLPAMRENLGSIPGLGRSPGGRNGDPLKYSCLENSTDRGAWWATVHGIAKGQT